MRVLVLLFAYIFAPSIALAVEDAVGEFTPVPPAGTSQVESVYSFEMLVAMNGLNPEDCTRAGLNTYNQGTAPYYACRRVHRLLNVDLTQVPNGKPGDETKVSIVGPGTADKSVLTIYMVQAPLEPQGRGIDWRSADRLIRSAYSNLTTPVTTDPIKHPQLAQDLGVTAGESIPNHGIGHIFVQLQCPGRRPILTGMTTANDLESPANFFVRNLGLGILLRTQQGRLNSYEELTKELNQRRVSAGNVFYVDYLLNQANCDYTYYSLMELIAEDIQKKYGSLTDRAFNGSGIGCVMFGAAAQQIAKVMPEVTASESYSSGGGSHLGLECKFYNQWKRTVYVPQEYLPYYEMAANGGQGGLKSPAIGLMSMLFSGDDTWGFMNGMATIVEQLASIDFEAMSSKLDGLNDSIELPIDLGSESEVLRYLQQRGPLLAASARQQLARFKGQRPENFNPSAFLRGLHMGVQDFLHGRTFLRETLQIEKSSQGYAWSEANQGRAFKLEFWDPQLFSDWIQKVRGELAALERGTANTDQIACLSFKRDNIRLVNDAELKGIEIDFTNTPPDQYGARFDTTNPFDWNKDDNLHNHEAQAFIPRSYFFNYDILRGFTDEENVDPYGRYDSEADLTSVLDAIGDGR